MYIWYVFFSQFRQYDFAEIKDYIKYCVCWWYRWATHVEILTKLIFFSLCRIKTTSHINSFSKYLQLLEITWYAAINICCLLVKYITDYFTKLQSSHWKMYEISMSKVKWSFFRSCKSLEMNQTRDESICS